MRKLLVPFDGSDNAMRALQHAIQLAKREPSIELYIARAFEPPTLRDDDNHILDVRARSEQYLKPAIEIAQAAGVKFSGEILIGGIAKALVEYAERSGCEGIVMGTRGMGAVGNMLIGSVATKVTHLTRLPVTLVK